MEKYILEYLDGEIEWYNKKAISTQCWYKWLKFLELLLTVLIPINNFFVLDNYYMRGINIVVGSLLTLFVGIHQIWNYHDRWIRYRQTCELLISEKFLAINASGAYRNLNDDDRKCLLVERTEDIMIKENKFWYETISQKGQPNKKKDN